MSTFIDLTNQLLRRLNEVEIAPADFATVRGVQALAKDAIRNSISKINIAEVEWSFNAAEHTQVLVQGQEEYSFPPYFKVADWNSFQIQKDVSLGVNFTDLGYISRDEYYKYRRAEDNNAGNVGIGMPEMASPSHGNGYVVTPTPDKSYTLKFRYYLTPQALELDTDQTRIPNTYDNVIIEGALVQMYMFRDNPEAANIAAQIFSQGIKEMQTLLINNYQEVYDTRIIRNRLMARA